MLSGDNQRTASAIASQAGIDQAIGDLLPDGRVAVDNAKAQVWMAGWSELDRRTLACPYSTIKRSSPAAA